MPNVVWNKPHQKDEKLPANRFRCLSSSVDVKIRKKASTPSNNIQQNKQNRRIHGKMERVGEITGWPHITFGRKRKIRSDTLFIERESNKIITVLLYCPIGKCSAIIYILKLLYAKKTPDDSNGRHVWINVTWHFIERSFISGVRGPVGERVMLVCDCVRQRPTSFFFFSMFACCSDWDIWYLEVLSFHILVPLGQRSCEGC